ncbi:MAG: hypothetical protein ABEI99_08050, partial [Halobaculum sp.]
ALLTIRPADSANAREFVSVESDGTVSVSIPNVNEDATTTVDELLAIQNNGSQPVSVYVNDSSSAVTFQSNGSSIDGSANAKTLTVGETTTVGLKIDTTAGSVSLDSVTVVADATTGAPSATTGVDLLVGPDGEYSSVANALSAASSGDVVGLQAGDFTTETGLDVSTSGVTVAGPNAGIHGAAGRAPEATLRSLSVSASGVTVDGVEIDSSGIDASITNGFNVTTDVSDITFRNNLVSGLPGGTGSDVAVNAFNFSPKGGNSNQLSNLTIKRNAVVGLSAPTGDKESTATGVRINTHNNPMTGVVIENNLFDGITAGATDQSSDGSEARGITTNTDSGTASPMSLVIRRNTIRGLEGESVTGIGLFEDGDASPKRIGPKDFRIEANVFESFTSNSSSLPGALFIGGYENLGNGHVVRDNNILTGAVVRFAGNQAGFSFDAADALNTRANYWGASDGPSGEDGVGGSGQPAVTDGTVSSSNVAGKVAAGEPSTSDAGYRTGLVPFAGIDP